MNRSDTIAGINAKLESFDDERLRAVAEAVASLDEPASNLSRKLTPEELVLIEQSKEDFRAGHTCSIAEARAESDAFIANLRQKYPSAP